jgi:hypothetical protein
MIVALEVNGSSDLDQLASILANHQGLELQLNFELNKFIELESKLAPFLSTYNSRVKSLKGSTSFEDTVNIASRIEDYFDIILNDIVVEPYDSSKHIVELSEFYEYGKSITVRCNRDKTPNMNNPFAVALLSKASNTKISFDTTVLSNAWFDRCILDALSDYIGEIYMPVNIATFSAAYPDFLDHIFNDFRLTLNVDPTYISRASEFITHIMSRQ